MTTERTGSCLCGAVKITAKASKDNVGACHCNMCRNWSGGPLMATDCGADVEIGGRDNVSIYDSSEWAERGFCNKCGSNLFYRLKGTGAYMVCAGVFGDGAGFNFAGQVFVDEKPDFYDFANDTNKMTGAEVFAMYAPPDSN